MDILLSRCEGILILELSLARPGETGPAPRWLMFDITDCSRVVLDERSQKSAGPLGCSEGQFHSSKLQDGARALEEATMDCPRHQAHLLAVEGTE